MWLQQARTNSWTSQRSLEAQVAALRQQLDISAATEVELQREIEVRHTPTPAEPWQLSQQTPAPLHQHCKCPTRADIKDALGHQE